MFVYMEAAMSFLKGSVTFQRFRIHGAKPGSFNETHLERLHENQAGSAKLAASDGIETGWAAGSHIQDRDFTEAKNIYPDHLLADFWVQTDKLPSDRLKCYYEIELKALSKDNPSGYPSKKQKREAKEIARDRLEQEAKDGRYLKWKCIPIAWDSAMNVLFFGAAGATHVDRLSSLWDRSFEKNLLQDGLAGGLTPITAASIALDLYPKSADEIPSLFVPGVTPEDFIWCPEEGSPSFLGNEFLLWLWHYAEIHDDTLKLNDGTEATFMFSGCVKVDDPRGQSGNGTLSSDSAVRLPEAKAAVKSGKLPRKAALTVVRNSDQFSFVIHAETLTISKCKLPSTDDAENQRDREVSRLQHVRDLAETIDLMYATFLGRRLSSGWAGELKEMQGWLKGGRVRS